jgi:type IV pilus assembly protein PilM
LEPVSADLESAVKSITQSQNAKKINISLSGTSVVLRYVNFSRMNNDELKQALKFEAQKYIPFPLNEVNLDGAILNPDMPDNKMLILVAAVKKDFLNQRAKIMQGAGLEINLVDIDSIALINAFNFNYAQDEGIKNRAIAILNIGSAFTNVNILENTIPRLSRDIPVAGNHFAQKGDAAISNLAHEIRTSFDYYESQSASSVEKIFLSGRGSLSAGLKESLGNILGLETEYWDPLKQITIGKGVDPEKVKASSAQLAVAVGLALRK